MTTADAEACDLILTPVGKFLPGPFTISPGAPATIGRGEGCQVDLDDRHISKEHARVSWTDDAWHLTDLGSHNGTYVNGWQLPPNDSIKLKDGDSLKVGPCHLMVTIPGRQTEQPTEDRGTYATRASIFLRLRDDRESVREVGWQEFRDRYAPVIVGYCRNAGIAAFDADDVLQDVMMGFFRRAPDFEYDPSKGHFRGYLKRATLNAIRKRARGVKAQAVSDEWLDGQVASEETHWEKQWDEQLYSRALEEARQRFDSKTIEAFELYCRRNVPAEEVAARLDISVNSVHKAKSRVLGVIRAVVERLRDDEG